MPHNEGWAVACYRGKVWEEHKIARLLGIEWRTEMTSGVRVHLISSLRYRVPLSFALRSEPSWKETPRFDTILYLQDVGYSQGVGFWFLYGFDAITICIEMGY